MSFIARNTEFVDTEFILYFTLCSFGADKDPRDIAVSWQDIRTFCNRFKTKFFTLYPERTSIELNASKDDLMHCVDRCMTRGLIWPVFSYAGHSWDRYSPGPGFSQFERYYKKQAGAIWGLLKETAEELAKEHQTN